MDRNNPYYRQVQLLVRVLPFVFQQDGFALKGGTAINLFVRDFPRLSVDIDLVWLGNEGREEALDAIRGALDRIAGAIEEAFPDVVITRSYIQKPDALRLTIAVSDATIKIELSPVVRQTVWAPEIRSVATAVEEEFGFVEGQVVAMEDLYGGKLCAALDRQHPRDLFDVMLLLENEGIDDALRKTFLIYLAGHGRPMEEMLDPRWQSIGAVFEGEFRGMASRDVDAETLEAAGRRAHCILLEGMTDREKSFLLSLYQGRPDWSLLDLDGISGMPALQWKLRNINRMADAKRRAALDRLERVLDMKPEC